MVFYVIYNQAQAGWSQHDYGHLSVFGSTRLNHLMHYFVIGHLKVSMVSVASVLIMLLLTFITITGHEINTVLVTIEI